MKASDFKYKKNMANTRRQYMGGIPGSKIVKFTMGNTSKDFTHRVELLNLKHVQIRHNALEAARIAANRVMEKYVGREDFMLKIIPYPHQIIREHKRVNVAQADRFQEGMSRAFGKPIGLAARVKKGKILVSVYINEKDTQEAKIALKKVSHKYPMKTTIKISKA